MAGDLNLVVAKGVRTGISGSSIDDLRHMLKLTESKQLKLTDRCRRGMAPSGHKRSPKAPSWQSRHLSDDQHAMTAINELKETASVYAN